MDTQAMIAVGMMIAYSLVFVICTLAGMVWLFRLWRRSGESAYIWLLCGLFFPLLSFVVSFVFPILLMPILLPYFSSPSEVMVIDRIIGDLFQVIQYLCIFIALSKFAKGAVPFSEIVAPIARRFRRST